MTPESKNPWDNFKPIGGPPERKRAGLFGKLLIVAFMAVGGAGLAWGAMWMIKAGEDARYRRRQSTYNQLSEREKMERWLLWCNVAAIGGAISGAGFTIRTIREGK